MFQIKEVRLVEIISIATNLEGIAIRSVLESFNIQIRMHYIGNVQYLLSLFEEKNYLHEIVIISCHGDEKGLFLPKLDSKLEKNMPYHKKLTAANCLKILNLDNQIIINTGCCLGSNEFAHSFLSKGAKGYIGTTDYCDADTMLLFIVTFLYFYINKNCSIIEAFDKAKTIEVNSNSFRIYTRN